MFRYIFYSMKNFSNQFWVWQFRPKLNPNPNLNRNNF